MRAPEITELSVKDTHRLIPAKYLDEDDSVLCRIAEDQKHLEDIFALDHATNDRLAGENNLLPGIGLDELVTNTRLPDHQRLVLHAHPQGSRSTARIGELGTRLLNPTRPWRGHVPSRAAVPGNRLERAR
jgi:hypothetical protein